MGGRYFVSGTQLGLLQALPSSERRKLVRKILDEQWIENTKGMEIK